LVDIDLLRERVFGNERIEQEGCPGGVDRETGMPVIGKLHQDIYGRSMETQLPVQALR
jgi:hypothetical protein